MKEGSTRLNKYIILSLFGIADHLRTEMNRKYWLLPGGFAFISQTFFN